MSSQKVFITSISSISPHPDPNVKNLKIAKISGFDVLVGKSSTVYDEGILFLPGAKIKSEYYEDLNLYVTDKNGVRKTYLDRGIVKIIKLKGEYSEGLFVPFNSLEENFVNYLKSLASGNIILPGEIWEEVNSKDNIKENFQKTKDTNKKEKINFPKHLDTEQWKYYKEDIKQKMKHSKNIASISLKYHGTSFRVGFLKKETVEKTKTQKLIGFFKALFSNKKDNSEYLHYIGTRNVIQGTYEFTENVENFRYNSAFLFFNKLHKGECVYGEIIGWEDSNKTIMSKNKDVPYSYGVNKGLSKTLVYRITETLEDGTLIELTPLQAEKRCKEIGVEFISPFFYTTDFEELSSKVLETSIMIEDLNKAKLDNPTCEKGFGEIPYKNIDEGIVIRLDQGISRPLFYKNKSKIFYEAEGINV